VGDDSVRAARVLASALDDDVTGESLVVDGGMSNTEPRRVRHPAPCRSQKDNTGGSRSTGMNRDKRTRVEEVMSTPLETISASASVVEAAQVMRDGGISALVVRSSAPGIVTSTDVLHVVADGRDPAATTVEDVMTAGVESVPPDLLIEEVAAMMTSLGIKHLPVVDGDDYVGMVSSTDVTAELA